MSKTTGGTIDESKPALPTSLTSLASVKTGPVGTCCGLIRVHWRSFAVEIFGLRISAFGFFKGVGQPMSNPAGDIGGVKSQNVLGLRKSGPKGRSRPDGKPPGWEVGLKLCRLVEESS
jgi:hypothetical protein